MPFWKKTAEKLRESTQVLNTEGVYFWAEQDGPVEREFKRKLIELEIFQTEVKEAFLVRVRYPGDEREKVALCLISDTGVKEALVNRIYDVFKSMFNRNEFLDIILLEYTDWPRIRSVAKPFFKRDADSRSGGC
jgi:hypothetical protein